MEKKRSRLLLRSGEDAYALVELLRDMEDVFSIESHTGLRRVNAKSILGVLCMMIEFLDEIYLVNETHAGRIPACLGSYLAVT